MLLKENISAIILAADSITTSPNGTKPRCLHQTVGFSSVLERQFKNLFETVIYFVSDCT